MTPRTGRKFVRTADRGLEAIVAGAVGPKA
jgi:hypothetical protein